MWQKRPLLPFGLYHMAALLFYVTRLYSPREPQAHICSSTPALNIESEFPRPRHSQKQHMNNSMIHT